MKITECWDALATDILHCHNAAEPPTPLEREAFAIIEMAQAYLNDGANFYRKGDLVNALAAFWYGAGWLHFGVASGLLIHEKGRSTCPFTGSSEILPLMFTEKLVEKTHRYEHLLDTARFAVECAGEQATINNIFAGKVLFIVGRYAAQGSTYVKDEAHEKALACFSYGHGWLDAGVTCGYFRIMAHPEIFTV